jgi:hypothetical protein
MGSMPFVRLVLDAGAPTSLTTILHLVPDPFPLFPPSERTITNDAFFCWQINFRAVHWYVFLRVTFDLVILDDVQRVRCCFEPESLAEILKRGLASVLGSSE